VSKREERMGNVTEILSVCSESELDVFEAVDMKRKECELVCYLLFASFFIHINIAFCMLFL
jgi:hypothetical protein